jgi:leucyl-tRNA synthetase
MDVSRFFLLSLASPDKSRDWNENGIQGCFNFLLKAFLSFQKIKIGKTNERTESKLNKAIKDVTEDIKCFKYNIAIIQLRDLFETLPEQAGKKDLENYLKLLHPFCPHITEELWEKLGNKTFISLENWPIFEESKINERFEQQDKAIEKLVGDVNNISKLITEKTKKQPVKAFIYVLPNELEMYTEFLEKIQRRTNILINIFSVNDKGKYDPEGKSSKVKPNRPGIYLE